MEQRQELKLDDVASDDLPDAYQFCQEGIRALHAGGMTYPEMAQRMEVTEPALKQFVRRGKLGDAVPLRRGAAFANIYNYLVQGQRRRSAPLAASILQSMAKLQAEDAASARALVYSLLMSMLNVSEDDQARAAERVYRRLYAFRNAAIPGYIVKSEITFSQIALEGDSRVWEFTHRFIDDNKILKKSDGLAVAINKTIYFLGDIQSALGEERTSEGLDIFVLRKPLDKAEVMPGFHVSMDDDRPLFANSVLLDADDFDALVKDSDAPHREEATGVFPKDSFARKGMFANEKNAEILFEQLAIDVTEGVLRVGLRKVFDFDLPGSN